MRRPVLVVVTAIVLVCLSGCGGKKVVPRVAEGEADTATTRVGEEEPGVPIYPGAELIERASGAVTTTGEQGETTWSGAELITDDSFSDVVAWYKGQLSGKSGFADVSMVSEEAEIGKFTFREGDSVKTVIINHGADDLEGKTVIEVSSDTGPLSEPTG